MFKHHVGIVFVAMLVSSLAFSAGCAFNTHGNRQNGPRLLSRVADVRGAAGKRVTLVGTARKNGPADASTGASIELRGGRVELPGYDWPGEFVDRPVSITGLMLKPDTAGRERIYRLGEIERVDRWSR